MALNSRSITKDDFPLLLALDKKVYPTNSPVTGSILNKWFKKNPEFGIIIENQSVSKSNVLGGNSTISGVGIFVPLNLNGWKKLIAGELSESNLDDKTIFDVKRDNQLCIHCYHLEKLDSTIEGFNKLCFTELSQIIKRLKQKNPELKVQGLSALSVTPCGIGLFEQKLGFKEREFITTEHILKNNKSGNLIILDTKSKKDIAKKVSEGFTYILKCKMLVLYPKEKSLAWEYLK
jgi:hypothetical protein